MQFKIEFDATHLENIMTTIRQVIATHQDILGRPLGALVLT
jgi:hypothetical protein